MVRMVIPTTILTALGLLLLGGVAAWYLHRLQREASRLLVASVAKVRTAEELELISYRLHRLNEFLLTGDHVQLAAVPALQDEAASWIADAKGLADSPQEEKLLAEIERGYGQFLAEYQKVNRDPPPPQHAGRSSTWCST